MPTSTLETTSAVNRTRTQKKSIDSSQLLMYRFMIFYRFTLALIGGYILSSLSAILIAEAFSENRSSAAMASTLIAFTLWMCSFIWVFMINKTLKASLGIIVPSVVLFVTYKLLGH